MVAKLAGALFSFVLLYYAYLGITTTPIKIAEVDSLTYHIPIAQNFSRGEFLNMFNIQQGLGFYPGVGEGILSLFLRIGIPLNLFNVLALVTLFFINKKLGRAFGLGKDSSFVFAVSLCLLPTVLRLVPTQTIDIWLAIFFLSSLYLLVKPQKKTVYFFKLGLALGLLTGVKYSGILSTGVLLIIFLRNIYPLLNLKKLVAFSVPFSFFGLFWFVRNYLITGNPFYPIAMFGLAGHPDFFATDWSVSRTLFSYSEGIWFTIQAMISEYLIWSLAPLAIFLLALSNRLGKLKGKLQIFRETGPLIFLGLMNFLVYLPQPSWSGYQVTVSNIRFTYPIIFPLILVVFLIAKRLGIIRKLQALALLSSMAVLSQLAYHPKLILIWLLLLMGRFL